MTLRVKGRRPWLAIGDSVFDAHLTATRPDRTTAWMIDAFLAAYPWDLIDDDLPRVLDRCQGELGATGVALVAASPPVLELRTRDVDPKVFRSGGGLLFHPQQRHYAGARLKPAVAEWAALDDPLPRIAAGCRERGLKLRAIVSAGVADGFAERSPEVACRNVFDASSTRSACLLSPDVQAFLTAIVADLSARGCFSGITITDFAGVWREAFSSELQIAGESLTSVHADLPLRAEAERCLLSLCFCKACEDQAQEAGVNVQGARKFARDLIEDRLNGGRTPIGPLESILSDHQALSRYVNWQRTALSSLLKKLRDAADCELLLDRQPAHSPVDRLVAPDLSVPHTVISRVDHADDLTVVRCPQAGRNELRWRVRTGPPDPGPELVGLLARAVSDGFSGVVIDHYGLLPDAAFAPIRQAIRFARRTSG